MHLIKNILVVLVSAWFRVLAEVPAIWLKLIAEKVQLRVKGFKIYLFIPWALIDCAYNRHVFSSLLFFFFFVRGILCNHLKCLLTAGKVDSSFSLEMWIFCVEIEHAKATLLEFKFHVCTITLLRLEYVHFQFHCQNVTTNFQKPSLPNSLLFNASRCRWICTGAQFVCAKTCRLLRLCAASKSAISNCASDDTSAQVTNYKFSSQWTRLAYYRLVLFSCTSCTGAEGCRAVNFQYVYCNTTGSTLPYNFLRRCGKCW